MTDMTFDVLTSAKGTAGAILTWVNWDKVDPGEVIAEGEDWMAMHLRSKFMEQRNDAVAIAAGASEIDIDSEIGTDFLDPITMFLRGHEYLDYRPLDEIDKIRWPDADDASLSEGTPSRYAIMNRTMLLNVAADDDYTLICNYYGRPPALSSGTQTNVYTTRYRLIFKQVLLGSAYQLQKDTEHQEYHYNKALQMIQMRKSMDDVILRGQTQEMRVS